MVITTTGAGFILLALGLTFCGWRFWVAFKRVSRTESKIGFLLGIFYLAFGFANGVLGFGALFFARNPSALFFVLLAVNFLLALVAMLGVYTAYYVFLPKRSSLVAVILVGVLGIAGVMGTVVTHPQPFITEQNGVDWNMSFLVSLNIFVLLLISIGSTLYVFVKLFRTTTSRKIKLLSLALSVFAMLGIVGGFIRLVLFYGANPTIRTSFYDIIIGSIGIMFIAVFIVIPIAKDLVVSKKKRI